MKCSESSKEAGVTLFRVYFVTSPYLSVVQYYCISNNFCQLLTFALEIFGKGNFQKPAMFTKISYSRIWFRIGKLCKFSSHLNISIERKLPNIRYILYFRLTLLPCLLISLLCHLICYISLPKLLCSFDKPSSSFVSSWPRWYPAISSWGHHHVRC